MNDAEGQPIPQAPPVAPMALPYSSLQQSSKPVLITVTGIIGIVLASLGLIVAVFSALGAILMAVMGGTISRVQFQTPGATAVVISEAVVGAALASALMTGSIGFLRLRAWSSRFMVWWALAYLLSAAVFLLLQILVVVPSQVRMVNQFMAAMPPPVAATMPASTTSSTGTTVTYTASPLPASAMGSIGASYRIMAVGKTAITIVFPIAVLVIMRLKSVRSALDPAVNGNEKSSPQV